MSQDEFYLPEEVLEWIGLKKSEYLSQLIELLSPEDYGFEDFHRFDHLIPQTLQNPDRSYRSQEDEYQVQTFYRLYLEEGALHHLIIGALFPDQNKEEVFVPILSFVTKSEDVVKSLTSGEQVIGPRLN